MADLNLHITRLKTKLIQLLKQHELLKKENAQQKKMIVALQETTQAQKEQLEILQQQQLILKTSLGNADDKEKKQLEQKINGYLKNIDKCISLLSHKQNP